MSVIDELQSAGTNHDEPVMVLRDGIQDAPSRPLMISRLAGYSLYGVLFVAASGLAMVKTFPELSLYTPFIPEAPVGLADPELRARMTAESNAFWANGGTDAACEIGTLQSQQACVTEEACQLPAAAGIPDPTNPVDLVRKTAEAPVSSDDVAVESDE